MKDFRKRLARAFADVEVKTLRRVRKAEVNRHVLDCIKRYITDAYYPRMNPEAGEPVGRVWGVDIYLDESMEGNNIVVEC